MDIREAYNNYILAIQHLGTRTQKDYRQKLSVFVAWCESQQKPIKLEQVSNVTFTWFVAHLKKTHPSHKTGSDSLSTQTLAGYYRVVKAFLNWCTEDEEYCEFVKSITLKRLKKPKIEEFIIETFTIDQVEALLEASFKECSDHLQIRDRAIVTLLWQTGIRAEELCTLRIANTDLQRAEPSIKVFGKGRKERRIPLQGESRKLLKQYIEMYRMPAIQEQIDLARKTFRKKRQRNPNDKELEQLARKIQSEATVFVGRYHRPMSVGGLYQLIRRLGEWSHVEGVRCSPHTFRHTYSANFMRNGGNIYTLSKLLGHTQTRVTEEYLKSLGVWDLVNGQE
jgi:integrase/recombinase XerD